MKLKRITSMEVPDDLVARHFRLKDVPLLLVLLHFLLQRTVHKVDQAYCRLEKVIQRRHLQERSRMNLVDALC